MSDLRAAAPSGSRLLDLTTDGEPCCVAVFGGVYNNHHALRAVLADARMSGAERIFCLGDVGGFGPHPDRSIEMLRGSEVIVMQGNYDDSVGHERPDCQCGYTDPRDNHYAQLSYDYTLRHTSAENRAWLRSLPGSIRFRMAGRRVLLAHGSPRRVNEFLWESTTPVPFIRRLLAESAADFVFVTHTGIPWMRLFGADGAAAGAVGTGGLVNAGAIGRPANDGDTRVWYALARATAVGSVAVELRAVAYDHEALAREMRAEALPEEFVATIERGWWTTCLAILPAKERARGRY